MVTLDETIASYMNYSSYMPMICSASKQHLFNKSKSIDEIMSNNKTESDYDTDYESELKYTSIKPLNNHIDSDNKSSDKLNMKKIRRGGNKAKKRKKLLNK